MTRQWMFVLILAFLLGFGVKALWPTDASQPASTSNMSNEPVVLFGASETPVALFDPIDPRIRVLYFGFTRCPDVCPTSLAMLAGALNQLSDDKREQLRPIFISIDPERDDAKTAATYAQYFHQSIEGLSAPLNITTPLAERYGVIFRKTELNDSKLDYTVDHNSYFYFVRPDGSLLTKVPHTLNPAPIIAAVDQVLTSANHE
ncbi:SCO family protein [Vibrio sp. SM6]|uniref:SCO family protein n=1 Tax=Vibrio agarilyticus TaxID=2726741 RepID=A0A7X8TN65_9VIBR|nr:SCO family protein [Vibrio agarilyticus]NLS11841.1 SCO family protein [Vibrio agarilyticus]